LAKKVKVIIDNLPSNARIIIYKNMIEIIRTTATDSFYIFIAEEGNDYEIRIRKHGYEFEKHYISVFKKGFSIKAKSKRDKCL
jgi:hypothetical protein